ncbi:Cell surface glycoprotein [uncultured archaeon]|nr:Cell surface glycoprotein [uncultured archaeon]
MLSNNHRGRALRIASGIIILTILLLAGGAGASTLTVNASSGENYTNIQDAINNASVGDTILVYSGTYYENVNVNKQLILRGIDNGGGKPVVDANGSGSAINLEAGNSTLEGFMAVNASIINGGIRVNSGNNIISNNSASKNYQGIYLTYFGNNSTLSGNVASNNLCGICLLSSGNNTLTNNLMTGNNVNFQLEGLSDSQFDNEIDTSNLVNGRPIFYVKGAANSVYDSSINAGTFYCISCINVTIKEMNLNSNSAGIYFWNTSSSRIQNVSASNSYSGLSLISSNNNTLTNNNASNNHANGIDLFSSNNNTISGNILMHNNVGIYLDSSSNNMLNSTISSYNYEGISMYNSNNNTLRSNNFSYNYDGIWLYGNDPWINTNNTFKENIVLYNTEYGIVLLESPDNSIYNNVFNNTQNAGFSTILKYTNTWNITKTPGTNIIGGPYLGGNFWGYPNGSGFSQKCSDSNKDGICDLPYTLDSSNIDNLPLSGQVISNELPPSSLSIVINNGVVYINSTSVMLSVSAVNTTQISFSNDNMTWSEWDPFAITNSWTLTSGDGLKTVYFRARNDMGEASPVSDTIILDTTKPVVTDLTLNTTSPKLNDAVNISVNISDRYLNASSIVVEVKHPGGFTNRSSMNGNGTYYVDYSNTSEYGAYNVTIIASDEAGNVNNTEKTWFITKKYHISNISIRGGGRGETAYEGPMEWNVTNFPGLVVDEKLNVLDNSNRTIEKFNLTYSTSAKPRMLNVVSYGLGMNDSTWDATVAANKGLEQAGPGLAFERGNYRMIGWQGQKYIAVNGKIDKLTRLIIEQDSYDTKSLIVGERWNMSEGWTLEVKSIDAGASPMQVWLALYKDGLMKDDKVMSSGSPDARPIYTYVENLSEETNVPVFVTYVDSITSKTVNLKYTWLISSNVTQINGSDTYGIFKDAQVGFNSLSLKNSETSISLTRNSSINLMDDLYFRVNDSDALEYFPYFSFIPPTSLDESETTDVTIDLLTNSSEDGSIEITTAPDINPGMNRSFGLTPFGKFITVNASDNIKNNLTWIKLRFYYTQAELAASGLDESSLKISWYDESDDRWQTISAGSPLWVNNVGVDTADTGGYAGNVWINISHLSTFGIVGSYPATSNSGGNPTSSSGSGGIGSSSGGGGGGGGGGTSGENFSNIIVKEKYDLFIMKDKVTSYAFRNISNPIMFVNITGNISAGETNVAVEVLRNTSTIVNSPAPGTVYKNENIWVGTSGFAIPKNIKDAIIRFRIENSWLESNKLAGSDVRMVKWDKTQWIQLETAERGKDGTYSYFEAGTNAFSPFAITALKVEEVPTATPEVTSSATANAPVETEVKPDEKSTMNLMFIVVMLVSIAVVVGLYTKMKRISK